VRCHGAGRLLDGHNLAEILADPRADRFRAAFRQRRCLVPATGFYEWVRLGKHRQPYHICLKDGGPFAFAGLSERWQGQEGEPVESCPILTTEANELINPLHHQSHWRKFSCPP
jgi:putative SOS response-associated peptidase YedK